MKNKYFFYSNILLLFMINCCNSARILGAFTHPGRSHFNIFHLIMKELTYREHSVDVISFFPVNTPIERYTDLSINGTIPILSLDMDTILNNFGVFSDGMHFLYTKLGHTVCDKLLFESPIIDNILKSHNKYDLMITHIMASDCLLLLAHILKIPVIGVVTSPSVPWSADRFGYPNTPSYIPDVLMAFHGRRMSFVERLQNTFLHFSNKFKWNIWSDQYTQKLFYKKLGSNAPSIYDLQKNMSLLLVNGHFSLNGARPTPPNVIEVSGLHLKSPENYSMSNSLEKLLNESTNGVIYFGLGTLIRAHTFDLSKQRALMNAFRQLPYTIIWKGDRTSFKVSIPNNIVFMEWTPQQELLCHPNVKLFITHGGALGTMEAIYCGVPMIAIPIFFDQPSNAFTYQRLKVAKVIRYEDISTANVLSAIETILNDSSYKENIEFVSKLFKDRPQSPMETAIYWIEYVLRYKGAKHLQPLSVELTWYQYYLIDVGLVIIGVPIIIGYLVYLALKFVWVKRKMCNIKSKTN